MSRSELAAGRQHNRVPKDFSTMNTHIIKVGLAACLSLLTTSSLAATKSKP